MAIETIKNRIIANLWFGLFYSSVIFLSVGCSENHNDRYVEFHAERGVYIDRREATLCISKQITEDGFKDIKKKYRDMDYEENSIKRCN